MGKQPVDGGRGGGRRPAVVKSAKRSGPGRGFWLALGVVAVGGLGALAYVTNRPKAAAITVDPSLPPMKAEGYLLGSASAPLEVIEFADFECPGCGQFATVTEPDIRTKLVETGIIRIRFMDYPLPMHRNTWDASLAAACANDQGKFWEMHDQIFATQDRWSTQATSKPRSIMSDLAKSIGLDMTKYDVCMDSEVHRAKIQSHLKESERRRITTTPSFLIGGKVTVGALPYDEFKRLVDEALAKLPARTDSAAPATAPTAAPKAPTTAPKAGSK